MSYGFAAARSGFESTNRPTRGSRPLRDQILLRLRSDWSVGGKTYPAGSLLAADFAAYLRGEREFAVLFEPSERKALASTSQTKNFLILNELDNVRSKVYALKRADGQWQRQQLATASFRFGARARRRCPFR